MPTLVLDNVRLWESNSTSLKLSFLDLEMGILGAKLHGYEGERGIGLKREAVLRIWVSELGWS